MSDFNHLIGQNVSIEMSGKIELFGMLIDAGVDIVVIYNRQYFYIPMGHIQRIKLDLQNSYDWDENFQPEQPIREESDISYRKTLTNAKGNFVSLYIAGDKTIHGYLTSIMNDYFVFNSPAHHNVMYISMYHLKWLIPYSKNTSPYSLSSDLLPVKPSTISLARTFTEQCKKLENQIVILDNGDHQEKIGLLKKVYDDKVSLVTAGGENVYWNFQHLKTIHLP